MCPADGYDVKPTRPVVAAIAQVMSCRANQPLLLPVVHRVGTVSEVGAASEAHFDENQLRIVGHHEIDFAGADAIVAFDRSQAAARQVRFRGAFSEATAFCRGRLRAPR